MAASFILPLHLPTLALPVLPPDPSWQSTKQSGEPEKHASPMVPSSMTNLGSPVTTLLTSFPSSTRHLKSKEMNYRHQGCRFSDFQILVWVQDFSFRHLRIFFWNLMFGACLMGLYHGVQLSEEKKSYYFRLFFSEFALYPWIVIHV